VSFEVIMPFLKPIKHLLEARTVEQADSITIRTVAYATSLRSGATIVPATRKPLHLTIRCEVPSRLLFTAGILK